MSTGADVASYLLVVGALVVFGFVLHRRRAGIFTAAQPDHVSAELVGPLMAEVRKLQAEVAYWKSTAERLQREADER